MINDHNHIWAWLEPVSVLLHAAGSQTSGCDYPVAGGKNEEY